MRLVYFAREKPRPGRAPVLQVLSTVRGLAEAVSDSPDVQLTVVTPWPASLVREQAEALTGRPLPRGIWIVSLGAGPEIPFLRKLWPSPVWGGIRARLEQVLLPDTILYTRALRAAADLGRSARVVFECHELQSWNEPALREDETRALAGATGIVAVTRCLAEDIARHYAPGAPIAVIPNAADPELFRVEAAPESGRFVYVGSLHPWKGLGVALEAVARTPGASLDVCGGERVGKEGRVTYHGTLAQPALRPLLARAWAGLLPLDGTHPVAARHMSPLKLFEYFAAGLPVVASDLPSLREHVRPEENGLLFPPGDAAALAGCLARLADPALRARLAAGARAAAMHCTWRRRGERIIEACRGLAGATPTSRA